MKSPGTRAGSLPSQKRNISDNRKAENLTRLSGGISPVSRRNSRQSESKLMGKPSLQTQAKRIGEYILGSQAVGIAAIGVKAGLFRAIPAGPEKGISAETLAAEMGFDQGAVRAWCRGAYAFGFLEWEEESGFRLGDQMEELLGDPVHPSYQGGQIEFYAGLNESYRHYPQFLRSGEKDWGNDRDPWLLDALQNLTKLDAAMITDHVLPQAPKTLDRLLAGGRILDVGAGEGAHVLHYARRFPRSRVIGLELDQVKVETFRKNLAETSLSDRAAMRQGDVNQLGETQVYDLITLNLTLHDACPPDCRNLLARLFQALNPGGTLLISEIPYPDSIRSYRDGSFFRLLSGVQLHLAMTGCGMITAGQLIFWLQEGGFKSVRTAVQPNPSRFVVLGERPANG